jgi:hypothetical protein
MATRNRVEIEFVASGNVLGELKKMGGAIRSFGKHATEETSSLNRFEAGMRSVGAASRVYEQGIERAATRTSTFREIVGGTFVGNIAADWFRSASRAAIQFGADAVKAAVDVQDAMRFLETSTKLTGGSLAENLALVEKVRERLAVSRGDAAELVARAAQFTAAAGRPADTERFLFAVADNAAASGRSPRELAETLGMLAGGGAEAALDRILGGKNPSEIFDEFGKSVGTAGTKLTTTQQKLAIMLEVLSRGDKVAGTANDRLKDTAGRLDALSARYEDLQADIGALITRNEAFIEVLNRLDQATRAAGSPETSEGIKLVGEALAGVAQAGVVAAGGIALFVNSIKVALTAGALASAGFIEIGKIMGEAIGAGLQIAVLAAIDTLKASLPDVAERALGIDQIDTNAARARIARDVLASVERVREFANIARRELQEDVDRFSTIFELTRQGFDVASKFGEFRPAPERERAQSFLAGAGAALNAESSFQRGATLALRTEERLAGLAANINRRVEAAREQRAASGLTVAPALIAFGNTLESVDTLVRVQTTNAKTIADATTAAGKSNAETIAALKATITRLEDKIKNLPAFSVLEVQAGPATLVSDITPAGGTVP